MARRSTTIRIPRADQDRPRPLRVLLSALLGLGLGLTAVVATGPGRSEAARDPGGEPEIALEGATPGPDGEGEVGARGDGDQVPRDTAEREDAPDSPSNDTADAEVEPEVAEAERPETGTGPGTEAEETGADGGSAAVGVRHNRVVPGRTAYLRCEGVPLASGPFPCPRDREMEQAVWKILRDLAACPGEGFGLGHVDVRLDYKRGEDTIARVLTPSGLESEVNTDAVYECVGEALTSVPTILDPAYMVVSFRFELQGLR